MAKSNIVQLLVAGAAGYVFYQVAGNESRPLGQTAYNIAATIYNMLHPTSPKQVNGQTPTDTPTTPTPSTPSTPSTSTPCTVPGFISGVQYVAWFADTGTWDAVWDGVRHHYATQAEAERAYNAHFCP